jgi:3-oxoacyl-[acyl-carrier protein] reductase
MCGMPSDTIDRRLAVVGGDQAAGRHLAAGLATAGATVAVVRTTGTDDRTVTTELPSAWWDMETSGGLTRALEDAETSVGEIDTVVWAWTEPDSTRPEPLGSLEESAWSAMAEEPIRRFLRYLQGVASYRAGRPGTLIALVPTLGMMGAPAGLVAWATATEGQRALAKVATRTWGARGLTVNCVGVAPERLAWGDPTGSRTAAAVTEAAVSGDAPVEPSLQRAGIPAASLGRTTTLGSDVAQVVLSLSSPGMRSVTGATIGVDGGVWMAP